MMDEYNDDPDDILAHQNFWEGLHTATPTMQQFIPGNGYKYRDNFQEHHNFLEPLPTLSSAPAMTSKAGMDGGGLAGMSAATPTMQQFIPGYKDRDDSQAHHNFLDLLPTLSSAPAMTSMAGMDGGGLAGMSAATPTMQQFIPDNGSGGNTAISGRTCGGSHNLVSVGLSLEQGKGGFLKPKKPSGSHKRSSVKNGMRKQNATSEATANGDSETVRTDLEISTPSHAKQRKLVSKVWQGFDRIRREDGNVRATCKTCKKGFDGSSKKGTTHLNNHLKRCEKRRNRDEDQELISLVEMGDLTAPSVIKGNVVFDQERCSLDLTRMIIKHHYPLNIVEDEFFKTCLNRFQPKLKWEDRHTLGLVLLRGGEVIPMTIPTAPLIQAQPGLAGPVRGVGGPAPGMMQPQISRPPMTQLSAQPMTYPMGGPPVIHPPAQMPPAPYSGQGHPWPGPASTASVCYEATATSVPSSTPVRAEADGNAASTTREDAERTFRNFLFEIPALSYDLD